MATATENRLLTGEVPREFNRYTITGHALRRLKDARRPIDRPKTRTAVVDGDVEENPVAPEKNEWRFRHRVAGCDVVVTCGGPQNEIGRKGYRIVTAFVDIADPAMAWKSNEWSNDTLEVAVMLQCLNAGKGDAVDGWSIVNIDVHEPVEWGGHALVCNQGYHDPFCIRCRESSIDGDFWKRRECLPGL